MSDPSGAIRQRALVNDDGQWYDAGTIVRTERTPAEPSQFRLVVDSRGDREVLECRRGVINGRPVLVVTLRRA